MKRKEIYIGLLVGAGVIFAALLTFIVYKLWRYLSIRKQREGSSEKNEELDTLPSKLFAPYSKLPITYQTVPGQEPVNLSREHNSEPSKSRALQRQFPFPTRSKSSSGHSRLIHHNSDSSITSEFENYSFSSPDIRQNDEVYNTNFERTLVKTNSKMRNPFRRDKSKRIIDLGRGNSLTEEMFIDSLKEFNKEDVTLSSTESLDEYGVKKRKAGKIRFTAQYTEIERKLEILIIKAFGLVYKREMSERNPFVRVYLYPGKRQKQDTKCKKESSKEPFFNEVIIFQGISAEELNGSRLKLKVCNYNRLTKKDILGEAEIELHSMDKRIPNEYTISLHKPDSKLGNASMVLSINLDLKNLKLIVKIQEAHLPKAAKLVINPNPFVMLDILLGESLVDRKQTSTKRKTIDPYYDEIFSFPLPIKEAEELSSYRLDVSLRHNNLLGKSKFIGYVMMSSHSLLDSAKEQWNLAIDRPNEFHKSYHTLMDISEK